MSFAVSADAYDRFMGRYSRPLAKVFADLAAVADESEVLDVGCGPGALTGELVDRGQRVIAVDPSITFVDAVRKRHRSVGALSAAAECLPVRSDAFDAALAQLVVHFMKEPGAGLREMRRVTRPGGVVAACVWDYDEGGSPLSRFWEAARALDADAAGEAMLAGTRRGQLANLLREADLAEVDESTISVSVEHDSVEEWWRPFELGVGPAGSYVTALDARARRRLLERCRELLPEPPFVVHAAAWAARGVVPRA